MITGEFIDINKDNVETYQSSLYKLCEHANYLGNQKCPVECYFAGLRFVFESTFDIVTLILILNQKLNEYFFGSADNRFYLRIVIDHRARCEEEYDYTYRS